MGAKVTQWRKDNLFTKWCWNNCISVWGERNEHWPLPHNHIQNLKWHIDLNVKPKTAKLVGENIKENCCDLGIGKYFLEHKKILSSKEKSSKLHFIKIKIFPQMTPLSNWTGRPQTGRKYLQYIYLTEDLFSEYIKNSNHLLIGQATQKKKKGKRVEQTLHTRKSVNGQ